MAVVIIFSIIINENIYNWNMQNTNTLTSISVQDQITQFTVNKENKVTCRILDIEDNVAMLREINNRDIGGIGGHGTGAKKGSMDYCKENTVFAVSSQNSSQFKQAKKYSYAGKQYLNNLQNSKISSNPNITLPLCQLQQQQPDQSIKALHQKIALLQKQKQKLLKRNIEYLQQNQQLTIKITLLKQQHKTQQADDKKRIDQMLEEINKLKDANKIVANKCKQLIKENDRICCIYEELQSSQSQRQNIKSMEQQSQRSIKEQQHKYQQLKMTNQSQNIAINTLQSALKIKEQQHQHILKQKQQQITKIVGELAAAKAEIAKLSNQVNIVRIQLQYRNMEYQTLTTKLVNKEKQLQYLTQQNTQLQQQNGELTHLHKTIQQQNTKIAQLSLGMGEKQKQIQQLKIANKTQSQTILSDLTKAHSRCIEELNLKICSNEQNYKQKIAALTNQHIELKSTIEKNNQKSAQGIQALKERNNKMVIQKQELRVQIIKLKEINARLNGQSEQCQQKYRQAFKQLQQAHVKMRNYQQLVKNLEEQLRQGQVTERQLAKCKNVADEQLQKIDKNYLQNKRELQANIKFLTEELAIWSQKYQALVKQNTSIQSQLLNFKSMYQILTRKHQQAEKNMEHSLISKKSSEKDYKQLMRQLESYKIEMQIMKEQKQKIENSLNQELQKRKEMIETLIKEKKMLYGGITFGAVKDN